MCIGGRGRSKSGKTILRWTLVAHTYKHTRIMILNNCKIMEQTHIQLAEVNNVTLVQCYVNQNVKVLLIHYLFSWNCRTISFFLSGLTSVPRIKKDKSLSKVSHCPHHH